MKPSLVVPLLLLASACAPALRGGQSPSRQWDQAHALMRQNDFIAADSVFANLAVQHPTSGEGRESLFYLGVLRLDPRNPNWNSEAAQETLLGYLASGEKINRRPEAESLLQLAQQLNLSCEERIAGLQCTPKTATVIVPSKDSQAALAENERLRRDLAARDAEMKQLREELARLQKLLTGQ